MFKLRLFPLIILLFQYSSSFAITPNEQSHKIFCPAYVKCDKEKTPASCKISDNKYEFWTLNTVTKNIQGTYRFTEAYAFYDSPESAECYYSAFPYQNIEDIIMVVVNDSERFNDSSGYHYSTKLMAYPFNYLHWYIIGNAGSCKSDNPKDCPIVEAPGLAVYFDSETQDISFEIYREERGTDFISYNKLNEQCGTTSNCLVGVVNRKNNKNEKLGFVLIDLTNPDVVKINNIYSEPNATCKLSLKIPFTNTLACEHHKL